MVKKKHPPRNNSNIGEVGIDSIRLNGTRIENLPIAEAARAIAQLPAVRKTDRENKVRAIEVRYPKCSIAWLDSALAECKHNIKTIQQLRQDQQKKILEYTAHIAMCQHRDTEIAKISLDDPERNQKIRDLKKQFLPYDVEAMRQQIIQFEDGCTRCDDVIAQEHTSIAELTVTTGLVRQRDQELKSLVDG